MSPTTSPTRPGRPRDEARHEAILEAAIGLVAEVGYDRMSMDAVAARARASKATIYRRWNGKPDLVVEAVQHLVDIDQGPDPFEDIDEGNLRDDLLAALAAMRTGMLGPIGDLMMGLVLAARRDEELAAVLRDRIFEDKMCKFTPLIDRAVERGEVDATVDADLINEVAPAVVINRVLQGQVIDDGDIAYIVDRVLLPLLDASPRTTPPDSPSPRTGKVVRP